VALPELIPFSKEAILSKRIWDVDTWPYGPSGPLKRPQRGKPSTASEVLLEWSASQMALLPKALEALNNKRLIAIPYLLTVGIGIGGGMFASSLFGQAIKPNLVSTLFWGVLVLFLCVAYFYFFPATFDYQIRVLLSPATLPAGPLPAVNPAQLNPIPQIVYQNPPSFYDLADLVDVIRRCTVRDAVADAALKLLKVEKFEEQLTIFWLSLSLKSRWSFFGRNLIQELDKELSELVSKLLQAMERFSTYDLEIDPNEWSSKGPAFLNQFLDQWDGNELKQTIETQAKSDWKPT
jgi:hypothetical protein